MACTPRHLRRCDQRFKNGRGGTHRTQRPTDRQAKRSTGDTDKREDAKVQRAGNDQHTGRQTTTTRGKSGERRDERGARSKVTGDRQKARDRRRGAAEGLRAERGARDGQHARPLREPGPFQERSAVRPAAEPQQRRRRHRPPQRRRMRRQQARGRDGGRGRPGRPNGGREAPRGKKAAAPPPPGVHAVPHAGS